MAKNLQHLIAYSGPVESSSWTHKACWCYPWELLCCSPYISTSFEADPNRLPHNTPSTIEQENSPSPSLTPVASAHHRREEAVGWENICALMLRFHPPPLPCSCSGSHLHPAPFAHMFWGILIRTLGNALPVCGDRVQCPGLVQSHSLKGGWSQLFSHRMSQCKAWALLL